MSDIPTKTFPLKTILAAHFGRSFERNTTDDLNNLATFMFGKPQFTTDIPINLPMMKSAIERQFPEILKTTDQRLVDAFADKSKLPPRDAAQKIVDDWILEQQELLGVSEVTLQQPVCF